MSNQSSLDELGKFNLNLLPTLGALLSEQSVSAAARRMGVSQSAMSHSLAKLRQLLDDQLLVTAGRGMALTPRAEQLAAELPQLLTALGLALRSSTEFEPKSAELSLRIATFDYFELAILPELLAYLRREAPGIRLKIDRFEAGSIARLVDGQIDFVLGGGYMPMPSGLMQRLLYRDGYKVIVRPDHPLVRGGLSLERYLELDHMLVSLDGSSWGTVDRVLAQRGLSRRVTLHLPHFGGAPLAVRSSDLVCTVAETIAQRAKELYGLRVLSPPIELPEVRIMAWWPPQHQDDAARRWFREALFRGDSVSTWVSRRMREERARQREPS